MFKIEMNTNEFLKAFEKVSKIAPSKHVLPIVECIKAEVTDNICYLSSSNLTQYIKTKVETFSKTETISFILQDVKQLLKAMKYFKDNIISFELAENNLIISCGNKKIEQALRFNSNDYMQFPAFDLTNTYNYNAKKLSERFDAVKYAVAKNDNKPILTGIHFNGSDMVTLDGYRMAINKDEALNIETSFTVPVDGLKYFTTLLNGNISIKANNKYIEIEDNNTIICSRLLEGEYIKYNDIIPKHEHTFIVNTKEYINELKYLSEFVNDAYKSVGWLNGKMEVINESGIYKTEVKMQGEQTENIMCFNCQYMIDGLNQFDGDIEYKIGNSISPIILSDNHNIALVLPIKSKQDYFRDEIAS